MRDEHFDLCVRQHAARYVRRILELERALRALVAVFDQPDDLTLPEIEDALALGRAALAPDRLLKKEDLP